jgi:hypothetical protein
LLSHIAFYFLPVYDAVQKDDLEDAEALKRFASHKDKSERFLCDILEKQVLFLPLYKGDYTVICTGSDIYTL